jgi:hypothetical protein
MPNGWNPVVPVHIKRDASVDIEQPVINSSRGQQIRWISEAARALFNFFHRSPFSASRFDVPAGGYVESGVPLVGSTGRFSYSVEVEGRIMEHSLKIAP